MPSVTNLWRGRVQFIAALPARIYRLDFAPYIPHSADSLHELDLLPPDLIDFYPFSVKKGSTPRHIAQFLWKIQKSYGLNNFLCLLDWSAENIRNKRSRKIGKRSWIRTRHLGCDDDGIIHECGSRSGWMGMVRIRMERDISWVDRALRWDILGHQLDLTWPPATLPDWLSLISNWTQVWTALQSQYL